MTENIWRPELSTSYVKELPAALLRSQPNTDAIDPTGRNIQVPLIRGDWKRQPLTPHHQGPRPMPAVTTEIRGSIAIIRINRPERLNAINQAVAVEMQQAFQAFDADDNQRVAILSGAGEKAFCSGADVSDLPELWRAIPNVGFKDKRKPVFRGR